MGEFWSLLINGWYVVAATSLMTAQPLLVSLTRNPRGSYDYSAVSTTLLVEMIKLVLSLVFYMSMPPSSRSHDKLKAVDVLRFAIPALLYALLNHLIFFILQYIDAVTY